MATTNIRKSAPSSSRVQIVTSTLETAPKEGMAKRRISSNQKIAVTIEKMWTAVAEVGCY